MTQTPQPVKLTYNIVEDPRRAVRELSSKGLTRREQFLKAVLVLLCPTGLPALVLFAVAMVLLARNRPGLAALAGFLLLCWLWLVMPRGGRYFVEARENTGELVGILQLNRRGRRAWVSGLGVEPAHRKSKVSKRLLCEAGRDLAQRAGGKRQWLVIFAPAHRATWHQMRRYKVYLATRVGGSKFVSALDDLCDEGAPKRSGVEDPGPTGAPPPST